MKRGSLLWSAVAAVVWFGSPNAQQDDETDTGPWVFDVRGGNQIRVVSVASGLVHPWSIAFLPDGDLLVAEQNGNLRVIRDGELEPEPLWRSPLAGESNDALKSVAVHPEFASNNLVYMAYPSPAGERGNTLVIARGQLAGDRLRRVEQIFVANAWEESGNLGGRIAFGPDNTLYVTVGDRDRLCCVGYDDASLRMKAQALDNHIGKTLRLTDDGGVPLDNPFVGRADAAPEVFTFGHRNGYGLSFHPETGELWQAEIGPMGGDEVNILLPGHNYGWPLVSTGRNYTGTLVSDEPWARPGMDNPRIHWVPSISPSSVLWYTGDKFPDWQNNLFVGALSTRQLQRIAFGQPSQAEQREGLLVDLELRVRDVAQSPDGYIYVATEENFGGSDANGQVLRIEPVADQDRS
ncbi:MAG TPA: PQQ-dependent sugar dehydrogenase [Gammaproteobacteria bacterium]|nr:PQQ-dependent sugar dehydrogenase [Gammaproteobacteria bacterium]